MANKLKQGLGRAIEKAKGLIQPPERQLSNFNVDEKVVRQLLGINGTRHCDVHVERIPIGTIEGDIYSKQIPLSETEVAAEDGKTLYGMGSFQKVILGVCLFRMIEDGAGIEKNVHEVLKTAWDDDVFDTLNRVLEAQKKEESWTKPDGWSASLHYLLLNLGSMPSMQTHLFAPDGTFLISDASFKALLKSLPHEHTRTGKWEYSNWNSMFVALIIETISGKSLETALREIVLVHFGMKETVLNETDFNNKLKLGQVAKAHIDGLKTRCRSIERTKYLSSSMSLATGGGFTCTKDMAALFRKILTEYNEDREKSKWNRLFNKPFSVGKEFSPTICGLEILIDSGTIGSQSFDQDGVAPSKKIKPYHLGRPRESKRKEKNKETVITKAGTVKGYSCHYYILRRWSMFIIVLTDSSGIFNASNHIGQYILQQALDLIPSCNIVKHSAKICKRRTEALLKHLSKTSPLTGDELREFDGVFEQEISQEQIIIQSSGGTDGAVYIKGSIKSEGCQSGKLQLTRISENQLQFLPPKDFAPDAYIGWLSFTLEIRRNDHGEVNGLCVQSTYSGQCIDELYKRKTMTTET
jgi:CubicO group peptidase (beta-lactamase class C family)